MNLFEDSDKKTAFQAKFEAQKIAFAPIVFQASKMMVDMGILDLLHKNKKTGKTPEQVSEILKIPLYGVKVLLELGRCAELVKLEDNNYIITKTGYFLTYDKMSQINMNFVSDVCYQGMTQLKESILAGAPRGLREFGEWETIYKGLPFLPKNVKKSWFDFDHFYSDGTFKPTLPVVFEDNPKRIFDIGGNTGKWALECVKFSDSVEVTIIDLPEQISLAKNNPDLKPFRDRISFHPLNILNTEEELPLAPDVIWMSQFLDCFSESQIFKILKRVKGIMSKDSSLYILDTYWDRQEYEASAFILANTSLYFACMANGNSKIYHSEDIVQCIKRAELKLIKEIDKVGIGHSLFKCKI